MRRAISSPLENDRSGLPGGPGGLGALGVQTRLSDENPRPRSSFLTPIDCANVPNVAQTAKWADARYAWYARYVWYFAYLRRMDYPRIIAQLPTDEMEERAVRGTAEGMLADGFPGTEGLSLEQVIEVVRRVHDETRKLVYSRQMRAADAGAYEYRRYLEELRKG